MINSKLIAGLVFFSSGLCAVGSAYITRTIYERKISVIMLEAAESLSKSQAEARAIEQYNAQNIANVRANLDTEKAKNEELSNRINRSSVDIVRLRNQLSSYAVGLPGDSAGSCHDRASTLSALLAQGAELGSRISNVVTECAKHHDDRAIEVESLIKAWDSLRSH